MSMEVLVDTLRTEAPMDSVARWKPHLKSALAASPSARSALSHERVLAHCRDAGHRWRESFWSPSVSIKAGQPPFNSPLMSSRAVAVTLPTCLASRASSFLAYPTM